MPEPTYDNSPDGLASEIRDINNSRMFDVDVKHQKMDSAMCRVLKSLGYGKAVHEFYEADRWYA